jgi:hypothetical protein
MVNIPDSSVEELTKEVYARFGLAYYLSECLHRGLCNVHALPSFAGPDRTTRARAEEKLAYAFSLTLGQVVDEVRDLVPTELHQQLVDAVEKRNYLAHHFWFDKIQLMLTTSGMHQMIDDLVGYAEFFQNLDASVRELLKPRLTRRGVTDEVLQQFLEEELSGKPWEPLPRKRKLKKAERLVRVWERQIAQGGTHLVFETEDGCLWELCDVGLGWTAIETTGSGWQESGTFKPFLPVTINPRPKRQGHWHYEINLGNRAVLWVRPAEGRSFRYGIRRLQP